MDPTNCLSKFWTIKSLPTNNGREALGKMLANIKCKTLLELLIFVCLIFCIYQNIVCIGVNDLGVIFISFLKLLNSLC